MDGWISVNRRLQNKSWYRDSEYVHVWIHLLFNASHTDKNVWINGNEIIIKRGQLLTSRKVISEKTGVMQSKVYRILNRYESEHQIEQQKTNKYTIITIVNYDKYQRNEQQIEQQMNNRWTTDEQQMNTNNNINNINNNSYYYLEQQFGRTLASAEIELLGTWQEWFSDDVINYAIDKTVLKNIKALSYTEAIINSWHDKGFKTLEECQREDKRFKEPARLSKEQQLAIDELAEWDWLNEN